MSFLTMSGYLPNTVCMYYYNNASANFKSSVGYSYVIHDSYLTELSLGYVYLTESIGYLRE